jgi:hypothetical protein
MPAHARLCIAFSTSVALLTPFELAAQSNLGQPVDKNAVPTQYVVATASQVSEPASGATAAAILISLHPPLSIAPVAVGYQFDAANSTAAPGIDFTANLSGTVQFMPGQPVRTIPVSVLADGDNESIEYARFDLQVPPGIQLLRPYVDLSIRDPQAPPSQQGLRLVNCTPWAREGNNARVFVERLGDTSAAASVRYESVAGSASLSDFSAIGGSLSWTSGDSSPRKLEIALTDDTIIEPIEHFTVRLFDPVGTAVFSGSALLQIWDGQLIHLDSLESPCEQ